MTIFSKLRILKSMKILCIHATAGAGHQKAAEALCDALRRHTGHDAQIVDALDDTSPAFKKSYKDSYVFLITKIPKIWSVFFVLTDLGCLQSLVRFIRKIYNHANARKLEEFLIAEKFDVIISCHFLSAEVASRLKREGTITSRLITVITDFDVHHLWLADRTDHYAVASEWTKARLESFGVPSEKITVTGIPVHEKFNGPLDKKVIRRKLGLDEHAFTVLIATGSFGIGPIKDILSKLNDIQVIVICGHNESLYEELSRTATARVKVFKLVDNMEEMMAASDAMVTKPGGLSTSEALARNLPMIFFSAIPGQEQGNVRVLAQYGIGVVPRSSDHIAETLKRWRENGSEYQDQCQKMRQLAHPQAAMDVVKLISP